MTAMSAASRQDFIDWDLAFKDALEKNRKYLREANDAGDAALRDVLKRRRRSVLRQRRRFLS